MSPSCSHSMCLYLYSYIVVSDENKKLQKIKSDTTPHCQTVELFKAIHDRLCACVNNQTQLDGIDVAHPVGVT